jgi:hypothetical protein
MARRIINEDTYQRLLESFRAEPDNVKLAATAAGCSWAMAKRAREVGWLHRFPWARPIREVLQEDATRGRAERFAELAQERAAIDQVARLDAAQALAMEGAALRSCMQATEALAGSISQVAQATRPVIVKLLRELRAIGESDEPLDVDDTIRMLGSLAYQLRQVNAALSEVQKAERLHLGEPSEIVGHIDLTPEARQDTIERAERALAMAQRAEANLRVIEGGKR